MSYILDALKKAEQDRAIGQVPGIGSEHDFARRSAGGRWLWVLLGVLLVNAALLALLFLSNRSPSPTDQLARMPVSSPPQTAPATPAVSDVAGHTGIVVANRPAVARPLVPLPPLREPVQTTAVGTDEGYVAAPATEEMPPPVAARNTNLPIWPQISGQLMRELNGSLHLDVHVYSDNPGERFVLINMRKYHTGQTLQEGPVVDEITTDGVILSFHGQRFRMQSQ